MRRFRNQDTIMCYVFEAAAATGAGSTAYTTAAPAGEER